MYLCQAFVAPALHDQCPAMPECPKPHPERKALLGRQGQKGVGLRLDRRRFPAAVMQEGGKVVGHRQLWGWANS